MTITPWTIYLITVLGNIKYAATCLTTVVFCAIAFAVFLCFLCSTDPDSLVENLKKAKRLFKNAIAAVAVCGALTIFVPSSTTLAAMYVLPAVVNSEFVQELPKELVELARTYVRNLIEEQKK